MVFLSHSRQILRKYLKLHHHYHLIILVAAGYSLQIIIGMILLVRMSWEKHVLRMGELKNNLRFQLKYLTE